MDISLAWPGCKKREKSSQEQEHRFIFLFAQEQRIPDKIVVGRP